VLKYLRYYCLSLFYPNLKDFTGMGLGIEARLERCGKYWNKHLKFSKEFQIDSLGQVENLNTLAIFGAGRLYDIPLKELLNRFNKICLYDADPGVKLFWKKRISNFSDRDKVGFNIIDLTFSMNSWTENLKKFVKENKHESNLQKIKKLVCFLNDLRCNPITLQRHIEVVFSINILSQIPIYWKERIYDILKKNWHMLVNEYGRYEIELECAIDECLKKLHQQHLNLITSLNPALIVILYDRHFYYYQNTLSEWQVESALYGDEPKFEEYSEVLKDSWLWHIAPQEIENKEYGEIHEVVAKSFKKITC